jgi:molybdopterin-biosynthesis enzyme MoeA-like protein
MPEMKVSGFGAILVGSEILDGRRTDAHFTYARDLLAEWNLELVYTLLLPDDPALLRQQLEWAMSRPEPFFCCGGIGATPDDLTRDCAALAAGVELARHPEGERILRARWGDRAVEQRLRMIDFPEGAALIPNPVNQVPGFSIRNGYFMPGFPEMAHPMMVWVLETHYEVGGERDSQVLILRDVAESDIVEIMHAVMERHPDIRLSSLPRMLAGGCEVHLGIRGQVAAVAAAMTDLRKALHQAGLASGQSIRA